jgi:ketosteroid isomerase-like protein
MSDIRSLLEALCEAFNAHELDAIMAYFADDCVLEMPRGPDPWGARSEGKKAVREALAGRFQACLMSTTAMPPISSTPTPASPNGPSPAPPPRAAGSR